MGVTGADREAPARSSATRDLLSLRAAIAAPPERRKLNACLADNAGHLTAGAVGDHVGKIQLALLHIDGLGTRNGRFSGILLGHFGW